jgi:hypothetical protein
VSVGAEGEEHGTDIMRIARPGGLTGLASLGLRLAEGEQFLAGVRQEIVAAPARLHAVRRPEGRGCGDVCRVKDYRHHGALRCVERCWPSTLQARRSVTARLHPDMPDDARHSDVSQGSFPDFFVVRADSRLRSFTGSCDLL